MFHVKHFQLAVGSKRFAVFLPTAYRLLSPFHVKHEHKGITACTQRPLPKEEGFPL